MIDQMYKTILRGFRNFYRKLYKKYKLCHQNEAFVKDKEQMLSNFIQDLGLAKFLAEQNDL